MHCKKKKVVGFVLKLVSKSNYVECKCVDKGCFTYINNVLIIDYD